MYYSTATLQIGTPSLLDLQAAMLAGASLFAGYGVDCHRERGIDRQGIDTSVVNPSNIQPSRRRLSDVQNSTNSNNWSFGERPRDKQGRGYGRSTISR